MQPSISDQSAASDVASGTSPLDTLSFAPAQTPHLKIAHVLFMDIVGYSRLPMRVQAEVQDELRRLVEATDDVRAARTSPEHLVCRPTGDGMALLFFHDLLAPVRCALAVSQALQSRQIDHERKWGRTFALRMGIHSGPILCTQDINAQSDVAGEGIVLAQRVMDAGDAGHILLSKTVADAICRVDPFHRCLHDMGIFRAKHGQEVHLFNLYGRLPAGGVFGVAALPYKVGADAAERLEKSRKRPENNAYREAVVVEERVRSSRNALLLVVLTFLFLGGSGLALCFISPAFREFATSVASGRAHANEKAVSASEQATSPTIPVTASESAEPLPLVSREETGTTPAQQPTQKVGAVSASKLASVPKLVGLSYGEAEVLSRARGFEFEQSNLDTTPASDQDIVRRQSLRRGSRWREGTVIRVGVMGKSAALASDEPASAEPVAAPVENTAPSYTGVIIDVRHLHVPNDQFPRIHGPNGEHLYPADDNEPNADDTMESGIIGYCNSIAAARTRCGANPVILRAVSVEGSTVRISAEDMARFQQAEERLHLTQTFKHVAFWLK